ncbi:phospholipase D family protein [Phycicoccus avicenniae]|uniref:phospholipase D family protein n=1 Tax=Phycicoccus avicenniae TaxID=2828860 RepID=UPI003D2DE800
MHSTKPESPVGADMTNHVSAGAARAALVSDAAYPGVARALIDAARSRCLLSMFIVELTGEEDAGTEDLVEALSAASWRGVHTRVVLGGSRENFPIAQAAVSARAILIAANVPARWLTASPTTGSHAKFLITDDIALLGSHNWTPGAFSGTQMQDSVAIDSPALAGVLHEKFEDQWHRAGGL